MAIHKSFVKYWRSCTVGSVEIAVGSVDVRRYPHPTPVSLLDILKESWGFLRVSPMIGLPVPIYSFKS